MASDILSYDKLEAICQERKWPRPTYSVWSSESFNTETAHFNLWTAEVTLDCLETTWKCCDRDDAVDTAAFMMVQALESETTFKLLCRYHGLERPKFETVLIQKQPTVLATIHCGPFVQTVVDTKEDIDISLAFLEAQVCGRYNFPKDHFWVRKTETLQPHYVVTIKVQEFEETACGYVEEILRAKLSMRAKEKIIKPLISAESSRTVT